MKFDFFDAIVMVASSFLVAGALLPRHGAPVGSLQAVPATPAVLQDLIEAKSLLEQGRTDESIERLQALVVSHPAVAEAHVLLGQALLALPDYPASLRELRTALLLDPDYSDRTSGKYTGSMIEAAISGGLEHARSDLAKSPGSGTAKAIRQDAYYLKRMLAGGCG